MPITHPSKPGFQEISWNLMSVASRLQSPFTLHSTLIVWPGEKLGFVATLPAMNPATGLAWEAFFAELNGMERSFYFSPSPLSVKSETENLGQPEVYEDTSGETVRSVGWNRETAVLRTGDWVEIAGNLHKVLGDADSDTVGMSTFRVWPKLQKVKAGTEIVWRNPRGEFRLSENAPELKLGVDRFYPPLTFSGIAVDA